MHSLPTISFVVFSHFEYYLLITFMFTDCAIMYSLTLLTDCHCTLQIHIARMAGCFSIVADQMDERTLSVYHAAKLCDEICGIDRKGARGGNDEIPTFDDREKYIRFISTKTKMVYDFNRKKMAPSIHVQTLDRFIQSGGRCESFLDVLLRQMREYTTAHPLTVLMIAVAIIWWFR
mgnify:CR=1 FL=1